jgi:hypothetical protein
MITRHIADLLFHHECVIVPGMGGFIKAYSPAQIFHATHEFHPPSASVAFNAGLYVNDGVLANYIATVENTSYREAVYEIKQWVDISLNSLKQGNKVVLESIGELFLNPSGKIEFTPSMQINFDADSFGLPVFQAKAVATESFKLPEIQPTKHISKGTKLRLLVPETLKWAAVLAPFIAFALWGSLNGNIVNNYVHNYTGMYSWVRSTPGKTATIKIAKLSAPVKEKADEILLSPAGVLAEENISFDPGMVSYAELSKNNIIIPGTVQMPKAETAFDGQNFHIIGGAFRDRNNALKLISMLQDKGYPATIVDTTSGGLFVVSMMGFNTLGEATTQLNEIKKVGFSSSWILKKYKG